MEVLFWTLCALWCVSLVIWICTLVNKKMRYGRKYLYPLLAMNVLSLIISILAYVIK